MYTAKGTTLYDNGVEIAYVRTYDGTQKEKYRFVQLLAQGLNRLNVNVALAERLIDLVGLVKAPDKNLQFYASQVRSALFESEKTLFDYAAIIALERDREELDAVTFTEVSDTLDAGDVETGALVFDESLHKNGLAQTLDMPPAVIHLDGADGLDAPKSQAVETTALLLGLEVRHIPLTRECAGVIHEVDGAPNGWDVADTSVPDWRDPEEIYFSLPQVNRRERDGILAGLRMLQMAVEGTIDLNVVGGEVMEIATESGRGLLVDEISALCDRLNT